ncbi:hypothetical protein RJ641_017608 [Dillenia turbinata]|uniref:CGL160/ATPI domain-containing protein n=1 Tax=Dillenia turbinata TaxID=194707 RepID=A0AAN8YZU3_9MAGN
MAVVNYNCYISVNSAATPIFQDPTSHSSSSSSSSSSSVPYQRPTKIILPKKKPMKWSTGVSPGEYGGPPTTSKLRRYWGGEEEDPITSDDYIWNKDFMGRMKRLIQDDDGDSSLQTSPAKEEPSGFLSLNRVMNLNRFVISANNSSHVYIRLLPDHVWNLLLLCFFDTLACSLDVDLTKELTSPLKPKYESQAEATEMLQDKENTSRRWRLVPTRREQEKWDRANKAATGGSEIMFRDLRRAQGDPEVLAAEARESYYKLKNNLQILTLGIGVVGLVSVCVSYSPEIAASFGAGLLGSLVYIRMLGSSVDSLAKGAKGLMKCV